MGRGAPAPELRRDARPRTRSALALSASAPFAEALAAHRAGRLDEAVAGYRGVLLGATHYPSAYNLAVIHAQRHEWREALAAVVLAERIRPGRTATLLVAGNVYNNLARPADAERLLRIVMDREADEPMARARLAESLFMQGRYEQAWPLWESRTSRLNSPLRELAFPEWKGQPLAGKSILIWGEQGIGDEIHAARFVPMLRERGCAHITVAARPETARVFKQLGADEVLDRNATGVVQDRDFWVHLWSLPGPLGVSWASVDGRPYLQAPAGGGGGGVGLALSGNPANPKDQVRCRPGEGLAEKIPGATILTPRGDALDSLTQLAGLDLVISVDTSWAHLAGALGKPCWLLLSEVAVDWRWFPKAERTPWYDSLRLFWPSPADGGDVASQVLAALAAEPGLNPGR